ncbi:MAG: SMC family ATPase [Chloroflexota bacterium]|nr:SMC family ATPase [Chloroflexota bacterium]MDE2918882.1 SMC family ATPase [Chloroflexota bacterium]
MFVHEVALRNVKSFVEATVRFQPGLTAIVGPNGAGKTTLLEAIGYGLFGFMPHRPQVRFMRHGSTEAAVQVEFTSPRDGRVYRVERTMRRARSRATGALAENATTTVSLFDVELNRSIDQPAAELEAWLAGQLGVEGLSSPADVFEHVVGVPQGRLTADFLDSPRLRKARFDPILRTAEYQQAADLLRRLTQHYAQSRHELQVKASHLEGRLAAEPELLARLSAAQQALEQTRAEEQQAAVELDAASKNLAAQDAHREAFEAAEREHAAAAEHASQAAGQVERAVAAELEARRAATVVEEARAAHTAYQAAQARATELQPVDHRARDLDLERTRWTARLERAQEDLAEARLEAGPHVQASVAASPGGDLEASFRRVRTDFRQRTAESRARKAAASVSLRQAREDTHALHTRWMRERETVVQAYDDGGRRLKLLEARAAVAGQLPDRRTQLHDRRERHAREAALLEADRHAQRLLTDTRTCPFFMDVCRNLDAIPDVAGVFRRQAVEREQRLADLNLAIAQAEREVADAEQAETETREADLVRERQAGLHQRLASADVDIAAATALLDALETRNAGDLAALANGQQPASSAQETLVQSAQRAVDALAEQASTEDPAVRTAGADLLAIAEHRREAAAAALQAADRQLQTLQGNLNALAAARAALNEHADAHDQYLKHEVVAGQLEARGADLATARQLSARAAAAVDSAEAALREARANFDPAALDTALKARDAALGLVRQLAERATRMQADAERLASDVEALRQVRADLEAAQAGIARVTRLEDRTEFIRRLLRDAGPQVTEILLASVSDTADEIYSDIMGAPGGRLRWAADYDIVLGRGGLERRFGQLSGGEQMAAALAVRLALLRDLLNLDIAFFDEPTQHLDAERRENLAQQILAVRGFSQLVVISHDDTFERHIDNILRVTHTGQASTVEVG